MRLYFVRVGDGPLMVFLHGHPDNWSLYEPRSGNSPAIIWWSRQTCAAIRRRTRRMPSKPTRCHARSGDLHGLLDHLGRERCILVGNDWGGYVAWVFASAYPARVERLIILNAPHPAIFCARCASNPAQIRASQYEREFHAAPAPYPRWYNYYRADPIKVPASIAEAGRDGERRTSRRISLPALQDRRTRRRCGCAFRRW